MVHRRGTKSSPISENHIIALLRSRFDVCAPGMIKGIGDDAAVIRPRGAAEHWVITTDMLVEGIDFQADWMSAEELGHRALAVNLSDVAAMGARPRFFVVALGVPRGISENWIRGFYRGLTQLGNACSAFLAGGDLSASPAGVSISITVLGESLKRKILYRSGGRAGDLIYVTRPLGRAAAGLQLLMRGVRRGRCAAEKLALRAQKTPEPRCREGFWLAQSGLVHCMMDVSDGLSEDLPRMCAESGSGAEIYTAMLPLFAGGTEMGLDPVELALHGGEDFGLLFCVPSRKAAFFESLYPGQFEPVTCIGRLTADTAIIYMPRPGMHGRRLLRKGFDHFRAPAASHRV